MTGFVETLKQSARMLRERTGTVDEARALADNLEQAAGYWKGNPLGGPAKVFDAVADRIRAGEDLHDVLADYGLVYKP